MKKQNYKYESQVEWAKMVRVSENTIFVIGGKQKGSLSASNQCLRIDLNTKMVKKRRSLDIERMGHGVCLVGHHIYVTGGLKELSEVDEG